MASQWGRDSSFQSGGRSGSAALTILAVILSLALGAAGGYGAFRFTQPDTAAILDEARAEAARLSAALAVARDDLSKARDAEASSAAQIEGLTARIAQQAGELDAMAERLAESTTAAQVPADGTAAVEGLTRERDALAADNKTLKADLTALEAERDALRQDAGAESARLADELARLQTEVMPQLTAERDQLQQQAATMAAELARLQAEVVPQLTAERDQLQQQAATMAAELARLETEVVPQLTAERDQLRQQAATIAADTAALEARISAISGERDLEAGRIAELEARLAEAERKLMASQQALEAIKAQKLEAPAAEDPAPAADSGQGEPIAEPDTPETPTLDPRDPNAVAAALRTAPGLGGLSAADREKLTDLLVAGECVTTALEAVFERVPILTLRNLIRDLNSGC